MDYTELVNQAKEAATSAAAHAQTAQEALSNARSISLTINNEKVVEINNCKENIRQAIINKGQECSKTVPFSQYANKILSIVSEGNNDSSLIINGYEQGFNSKNDGYYFVSRRNIGSDNMNLYLLEDYSGGERGLITKNNKYKFKSFANCDRQSIAIGTDGNLYGWGRRYYGSFLTKGDIIYYPKLIDGSGNWKKVWSKYNDFFALNNNGELFSAGDNNYCKIGNDIDNYCGLYKIDNIDGCKWKKAESNEVASYFLTEDGRLFSCGRNENGLRGIGRNDDFTSTELTEIINENGSKWTDVSALGYNAYALSSDGKIYGWGRNNYGQLGTIDGDFASSPVHILCSYDFIKISAGYDFLAAICVKNRLWTIGRGDNGRNGLGENVNKLTAIKHDKGYDDWVDVICSNDTLQCVDSYGKVYRCGNWAYEFGLGQIDYGCSQPYLTYIGVIVENHFFDSNNLNVILVENFETEKIQYISYLHDILNTIIVPDDVKRISSNFMNSKNSDYEYPFSKIYIPNTVETIDGNAFSYTVRELFFQASKEEVEAMSGYPWGFETYEGNIEDYIHFNCEFEHDEASSDLIYFIENNFPDDYVLTVPQSATRYFSISNLNVKEVVLNGEYEPYGTMFYNMPNLQKITLNRTKRYPYDYVEGSLYYSCPSKITVNCNWAKGDFPTIENNISYSLKGGDEVKYLIEYDYVPSALNNSITIDGNITKRIMVCKTFEDNVERIAKYGIYSANSSFVMNLLDKDKNVINIEEPYIFKSGIYYIDIKNTLNNSGDCSLAGPFIDGEFFHKCCPLITRSINNSEDGMGFYFNASHSSDSVWQMFNYEQKHMDDGGWYSGGIGVSEDNPAWFSVESEDGGEGFVPIGVYIMNEICSPENFKNAKIQGKTSSGEWVDLYEITDSPNTASYENYILFTDNTTTYYGIRMYFTEAYNSGVSIQAFNVYAKYSSGSGGAIN
jgi:alpha-tubulin suppressor-like RCC1 family protein